MKKSPLSDFSPCLKHNFFSTQCLWEKINIHADGVVIQAIPAVQTKGAALPRPQPPCNVFHFSVNQKREAAKLNHKKLRGLFTK